MELLHQLKRTVLTVLLPVLVLSVAAAPVLAHDVSAADIARAEALEGPQVALYMYLGAKHMVTGYDHLLFLLGVMFLLTSVRSVLLLATMFALGHTVTLLSGVLLALPVNPFVVDAVIGLSVAYKGADNLGLWKRWVGRQPNEAAMVFGFGLVHGLGLASKLRDLGLPEEGVVTNLLSFNVGVELGQLIALWLILLVLAWLTYFGVRERLSRPVNGFLIVAGFLLCGYQLSLMGG